MKISSKTHYGVQVCFLLGLKNPQQISTKELEKMTNVSSKYLEKVMKILLGIGVVKATRGVNGGYSLNKEPSKIKMGEVVRALEEDNLEIIDCVSKSGCCCPSSWIWKKLYSGINDILDGITLKDMLDNNVNKVGCANKACGEETEK